jgi:hypothetical protein
MLFYLLESAFRKDDSLPTVKEDRQWKVSDNEIQIEYEDKGDEIKDVG